MPRILLVDDQLSALTSLSALLTALKFEVATAATPEAARVTAEQFQPDVAVIDWFLADGADGGEVARELVQSLPQLQCIFITGTDSEAVKSQVQGARVLGKPFSIDELVALLESALTRA